MRGLPRSSNIADYIEVMLSDPVARQAIGTRQPCTMSGDTTVAIADYTEILTD